MIIYVVKLFLVFLICNSTGETPNHTYDRSVQPNEFNTFLFDVGLNDEVKTQEFPDRRRYEWLSLACDFSSVNDSSSRHCNFGSSDKKWHVFYGANAARDKDETRPVYPSLGFWSEKEKSATLYSDPIPCMTKGASSVTLNVWVRGSWMFQICFLHMKNGTEFKCGSVLRSRNLIMHKMNLVEPFPDYVFDSDVGPMIVSLNTVIKNGVILLDDIEVSGAPCELYDEKKQPLSIVDIKDYSTTGEHIRNELLAPITKRFFAQYLETIMNLYSSTIDKLPGGHICDHVRCRANDDTCFYDRSFGTVQWSFEKRSIVNMKKTLKESVHVAKFPSNVHAYAILTTGRLSIDSELLETNVLFGPNKGKFQLMFAYNNAAYKRKILVCHYWRDSAEASHKCRRIVNGESRADRDWIDANLFIPNNIDFLQIVVIQNKAFNENKTEEVIIRDIKVINCYQLGK